MGECVWDAPGEGGCREPFIAKRGGQGSSRVPAVTAEVGCQPRSTEGEEGRGSIDQEVQERGTIERSRCFVVREVGKGGRPQGEY